MNGPSAAEGNPLNYPQFLRWRDEFKVFEDIAAYFNWSAEIGDAGEPERVTAMRGSASLSRRSASSRIVGRLFTKADEPREAEPVVLLSEPFWRRSTTRIRTSRAGASSSTSGPSPSSASCRAGSGACAPLTMAGICLCHSG